MALLLPVSVHAEEPEASSASGVATDRNDEEPAPAPPQPEDEGDGERLGITPFPIVYYTPETNLALGGGVVFTWREKGQPIETRPDNMQVLFAYTLNNQMFLSLAPNIYFNEQRGEFFMNIGYYYWPSMFFGVGNCAMR